MSQENDAVQAFITHWSKAEASEMANSQSFIKDLTAVLGVPPPSNSHADGYSFEFPVKVPGSLVGNRIDLYRRGHFVWKVCRAQGAFGLANHFPFANLRATSALNSYL